MTRSFLSVSIGGDSMFHSDFMSPRSSQEFFPPRTHPTKNSFYLTSAEEIALNKFESERFFLFRKKPAMFCLLVSTVVVLLVLSFAVWFKEDETSDGTLLPTDTPETVGCVGTERGCDRLPSALPPPQTDDALLTHLSIYTTIRFQDMDIEQFAVASFDIAFRGDLEHAILNPTRNVTYGALEVSAESMFPGSVLVRIVVQFASSWEADAFETLLVHNSASVFD
eukprot:CAMPEP_0198205560 /NCGR_PEP_ID=MMETSP1445-20131203/9104_1 /TAXON_ID=36898 /ORGANISM="Pyramimonas sp., Strain CCMP2087" /LENGTH=223 /DNA_ID=CAMNT_0043877911 /DNA_START=444 /DNA_END=1112 /DNA_ORIENTATION=-